MMHSEDCSEYSTWNQQFSVTEHLQIHALTPPQDVKCVKLVNTNEDLVGEIGVQLLVAGGS